MKNNIRFDLFKYLIHFFRDVDLLGDSAVPMPEHMGFQNINEGTFLPANYLLRAALRNGRPPEVAAAGHDRCIVPIKPENVSAWLNPDASNLEASYAILDDRDRPFYEHRLAA
uniref:hypothetical protein n=1 Tax=Paraburkholderia strydomiana TaxID=1245417 RepID=UPI0038B8DF33